MINITIIEQQSGNSFSFYDNKLGTILRSFEGFEYASVRESIDDVAGEYGAVYITSKHGRRRAAWIGDLLTDVSKTVFERRQQLLKALRQTGTMKLIKFTTYDGLALQFEAEVIKHLNPYTHAVHTFLIEVIAPDWRFYAQEESMQTLGRTSVSGGASIPTDIPMSIVTPAAAEQMNEKIVENVGSEATDPVITIHGPGTNFTVGNFTTGEEFILNSILTDTDSVVIDIKNRTVVKNDTDNLYPDITGEFWSLIPGENELRFNVQSGATFETQLTLDYRAAYGGI